MSMLYLFSVLSIKRNTQATAMAVGIVIGSGVFFKAESLLKATGGNMPLGMKEAEHGIQKNI